MIWTLIYSMNHTIWYWYEYKLYTMMSWNKYIKHWANCYPRMDSAWTVLNSIRSDYTTIPICYFSPVRRATVRMLRCILMNLPYSQYVIFYIENSYTTNSIKWHVPKQYPWCFRSILENQVLGMNWVFAARFFSSFDHIFGAIGQYNWHSKILENGAN